MSQEPSQTTARLHAMVEGRVQGVGYRQFVFDAAATLKLKGWVRNRRDGSVEVLAEGPSEVLGQLLTSLQRGPRMAYVTGVHPHWLAASSEFPDFQVRSTV